jgi:hypothetical protein
MVLGRVLRRQTEQHLSRVLQMSTAVSLRPVARDGGGLEAEDAELGLYLKPKQVYSAAVAHHADQVAAGVRPATPDEEAGVHVDGQMGFETYEEAECSHRVVAVVDREAGSAVWRSAQAFVDDLGRQKSVQLDLWACVCTAYK